MSQFEPGYVRFELDTKQRFNQASAPDPVIVVMGVRIGKGTGRGSGKHKVGSNRVENRVGVGVNRRGGDARGGAMMRWGGDAMGGGMQGVGR